MSEKPISFRLNAHDANFPDDSAALAVYQEWLAGGYQTREIMTRALLALGGQPPSRERTVDGATRRLLSLANRLERAIDQLQSIDQSEAVYTEGENAGKRVDFGPISTILRGMRPAVHDGDDDD